MDILQDYYNTGVTDPASATLGEERRSKKLCVTKDVLDLWMRGEI